ncbi:TPA: hypothetical protein ACW0R2_004847 [Citrobacter freundii]|nr:hypothetical protein [Citrobacter freundii]
MNTCSIPTLQMKAGNIYAGVKVLVEGFFYTVAAVSDGEYCGQPVIEVDFDLTPERNPGLESFMHCGFYRASEIIHVHPSSNQVLCL